MSSAEEAEGEQGPIKLEGDWVEYFDESHQRPYYYNVASGETVWVKPGEEDEYEDEDDSEDDSEESGEELESEESGAEDETEKLAQELSQSIDDLSDLAPASSDAAVPSLPSASVPPNLMKSVSSTSINAAASAPTPAPAPTAASTAPSESLAPPPKLNKKVKSLSEHRKAKAAQKAEGGGAAAAGGAVARGDGGSAPALPSLGGAPSLPTLGGSSKELGGGKKKEMAADDKGDEALEQLMKELRLADRQASFSMTMYGKSHYALAKGGLMSKGDTLEQRMRWQSADLKKALHERLNPDTKKTATKLFPFVQSYMGDRSLGDMDVIKIAQHLIKCCIVDKDLRNEMFCQLCKQTTNNPKYESNFKGWQLLSILCGCVMPTGEFTPYLQSYLAEGASRSDEVGQLAKFALKRLQSTINGEYRRYVPCREELEATRLQKAFIMRIYFLDDTYKTVAISSSLNNREMCEIVAEKIRLKVPANFSLFEYKNGNERKMLKEDALVLDVMGRWAHEDEKAFKAKEIPKDQIGKRHKFVFKPKLVLNTMEDVSDPACVDLLYVQSVHHTLAGNYTSSVEDAVKMAALQLQVQYGDHSPETASRGLVANSIAKYIPQQWLRAKDAYEWEKIVFELHARVRGRKPLDAKLHYLSYVKKRQLYGASFYNVKQNKQFKDCPQDVMLAINAEGVWILKPGITKQKIAAYPFSEIVSWAFTGATFTFVTGDLSSQNTFTLQSDRGFEMSSVCQGYVNALLEASEMM